MSATDAVPVAPSNREQLQAWDGGEGTYWAANADYYDRAVAAHHRSLLDAAAIGAAERVLDIGCGTGQTTRDAARTASAGSALGVDLSTEMLAVARARATADGVTNIAFEQADAQIHPFDPATFDVTISRTGTMFFGDMDAAFANIARALRPGGRIALQTWQPIGGNEWIREFSTALAAGRDMGGPPPGVPGPFALSEPDRVRMILGGAGFTDIKLDGVAARMWFGTDAADAHRFVLGQLGWMLQGLDDAGRGRALDALMATMRKHETSEGVVFASEAWIITASKPS
jgi:SAM-dependent methyltransferase